MSEDEAYLLAPFAYIRKMPGKQVRSRLATAFNLWLKIGSDTLEAIMCTVEMLHNASLMIDDIEDSSTLRRGLPVTHSIYGVPRTINTANYVYFVALSNCLQLKKPKAVDIFTEQMLELHRGQGKELYWRDTVQCPTELQYEQMVIQKTGGLFGLAIRDDYINLCSRDYAEQKSFAEDLTEGKFSFPIVTAIQRDNIDDEILNILRQRTKDNEVKKYCIRLLYERGAFRYTLGRLKELYEKILLEVKDLGGNGLLESLMEALNNEIANDTNGIERDNVLPK